MEEIKITKKEFMDAASDISLEFMEDIDDPSALIWISMLSVVFTAKLAKKLFGNKADGQA